ncbi:DNA polymerase delta subunit 3 isoform X2 [Lampris incognitus]|uniref:DNA polymerase delta subunit 3 isoform X2 n=1 Tax=Lampris incognitus TaxID=2546036 RepID=UPI0024B4BFF5|nr:DNA polymerase delta subunit 3 isoform X2 [Lampris incognitus]
MDDLYLDNIDEFINDHNKIVTYKWLSLTLGVHVNIAKQMLFHYLDHKRKESSAQLHATYLVSGKFIENGQTTHRVSVVREEQLEDVKSKMNLTVSVHVYSVQKAVLKDSGPLYSVDYDAVKDNLKNCSRYSAIQCASAVPMSSAEVEQAREKMQTPVPEPQIVKSGTNGHASLASKPSTKQPKGIMGMFANKTTTKNQDGGKEIKLESKKDVPVVETPKSKPAGKTNPMINFFGNQAAKKPEKTVKKEEVTQSSPSVEQRPPRSPVGEVQEPVTEDRQEGKKDTRSKTKRTDDFDSEEEKVGKKKRRRIRKPQPDSSDDEVIPDSPLQQKPREPSPSPEREGKKESLPHPNENSQGKIRKRRRVLKSHTFLDDEGCIVTEKRYESESYSESDDNDFQSKQAPKATILAKPLASKKEEKKSQKKPATNANKGTKQASIMGFFQKK